MRGGLHRSVAFELFADLDRQIESLGWTHFVHPEGDEIYKVPGSHLSFRRRPDLSIRSRVIASVGVDMKNLRTSLMYQKEYFQSIPELRLALLFKFYTLPEDEGEGVAAVVVVFRRNEHGVAIVDEAVSFGSAPLPTEAMAALNGLPLREVSMIPAGPDDMQPEHRTTVTIPAADNFGGVSEGGSTAYLPDVYWPVLIALGSFEDTF